MRIALAVLSMLVAALAQDDEGVRRRVAQLGESDAAARQAAQDELEGLGTAPEPALKEALKATNDPEARTRIEGLLVAIKDERALFEAIPPERMAELSPLVHAFHAEWSSHMREWEPPPEERQGCGCDFKSVEALARSGGAASRMLSIIFEGWEDQWTAEDGPAPGAFLAALVPPIPSNEAPGLDELGPYYAELITKKAGYSMAREALLRAFAAQRSLGAATALVAWVHSTRAALRGELTGGCTGNAAPLYNDLMMVQRALKENGDRRLVPLLIELLDEEDQSREFGHIERNFTVPSPTHLAIEVLRALTGEDLPYDGLSADRAARAEAIAAWRAWYEAHKAEFSK